MSPSNQRAHKYSHKSGPKRQPVFLGEANVGKMYDATAKAIIVVDTKQVCNQAHQAFPETNSHLEARYHSHHHVEVVPLRISTG